MFLLPWFFAGPADVATSLRACGALPKRRELHDHCGMNKRPMRLRSEYTLTHFNGTNGRLVLVYDFYRGHIDVLLPCLPDKDQPTHGTGNGPCDKNEIFLRSSFDHGQSLHGDPLIPHLPGKFLILHNARGIRTGTHRSRRTMKHGTVTGRTTREIVTLHDALKPFSL